MSAPTPTPSAAPVLVPGPRARRPTPALVEPTGDVAGLTAEQLATRGAFPLTLVSMPFALPYRPSLQIGLLASIASSHAFPTTQLSLFLDFAREIGLREYGDIAYARRLQLGNWLFSPAAFGADDPDPELRLVTEVGAEVLEGAAGRDLRWLTEVRSEIAPRWIERMVETRDWGADAVVGFTSTFQQNAPSFALARRIKQRWPEVHIVFGGANFDGAMGPEWMRTMPFIDHAITGEADRSFPSLLIALAEGTDPSLISGVLTRGPDGVVVAGPVPEPLDAMDSLPLPDYGEYFERAAALHLLDDSGRHAVEIPFESSRGCWWGEKATCRFCGLNGSTMSYRSKSPELVLEELAEMARRYGSFNFFATDNILDLDYLDKLLDPIAQLQASYWLFYEVKATLGREEMGRLHAGGVRALQPGIESFSSHVLRLMRKGTRTLDNVNLLRWARYFGIELYWNLLWGFPGETVDDYVEQARVIRLIPHLEPPEDAARISLERFSPYFEAPDEFPVRGERAPHVGLRYSYPAGVDLERAGYSFDGELAGSLRDEQVEPMLQAWRSWRANWGREPRPRLQFWWAPGSLRIEDARSALAESSTWFTNPHADTYRAISDRPTTAAQAATTAGIDVAHAVAALDDLCRRGLAWRDGNLFLALATPGPGQR